MGIDEEHKEQEELEAESRVRRCYICREILKAGDEYAEVSFIVGKLVNSFTLEPMINYVVAFFCESCFREDTPKVRECIEKGLLSTTIAQKEFHRLRLKNKKR